MKIEEESEVFFLYDHAIDPESVEETLSQLTEWTKRRITPHIFKKRKSSYPDGAVLFVMVPDGDFLAWVPHIRNRAVTIVILPYDSNPRLQEEFALPPSLPKLLETLEAENLYLTDRFLTCNENPVLGLVRVGESEWVEEEATRANRDIFRRFGELFTLRLRPVEITTAKEQQVKTAALLVEAGRESLLARERPHFFKAEENQCRRSTALVYAPQSIVETLKLRLLHARLKQTPAERLPKGIGTLKSEKLTLRAADEKPLTLFFNGKESRADGVKIESVAMAASIVTAEQGCAPADEKESIRIQNLPTESDAVAFFTKKTLPFIPVASESAFAELFTKLRDSALMSRAYLILLVVSVLMATTGLFQNSSPTIIGAMILAPLMAPIIAFAMGAIRFDGALMLRSLKTVSFSVLIALTASAFLAWALPFTHVTEQIAMRTHPTLLDLAVAVLAGIAAAYGYANSKVGESLAGVAIAVALVPPLSVAGIGIGWESWSLFANAFLLFLANIVGIVFASGIMFYLLGFASRKYASAAFFVKLLMLAVIAVPLWLSTRTLVVEEKIFDTFKSIESRPSPVPGLTIHLRKVEKRGDGYYATVSVIAPAGLKESDRRAVAAYLKKRVGKGVHLLFTYTIRY
ncbi:TIGR00341 family protein [Hydrogenimonas sp. SS33]|uniref:TIGR00341 family protein n=1 Tax=Hydrogenimonas leucolamina TaxID=2954236 RepID=UPI00336BD54D